VLERAYFNGRGERVMLSAAYGSEQSPALQVHQPEVCYVASGFQIEGKKSERMTLAQRNVPVTRLHARLPGRSEPITYWIVLGDTATADSGAFRWLQLSTAFSGRVRDGMLVRVSSLDPDPQSSYELHARFAADLLQAVPSQYRDRVFGAGT
jgi:EpsI family protein